MECTMSIQILSYVAQMSKKITFEKLTIVELNDLEGHSRSLKGAIRHAKYHLLLVNCSNTFTAYGMSVTSRNLSLSCSS